MANDGSPAAAFEYSPLQYSALQHCVIKHSALQNHSIQRTTPLHELIRYSAQHGTSKHQNKINTTHNANVCRCELERWQKPKAPGGKGLRRVGCVVVDARARSWKPPPPPTCVGCPRRISSGQPAPPAADSAGALPRAWPLRLKSRDGRQ